MLSKIARPNLKKHSLIIFCLVLKSRILKISFHYVHDKIQNIINTKNIILYEIYQNLYMSMYNKLYNLKLVKKQEL